MIGVRTELDRATIGLGVLALVVTAANLLGGELGFRIRGWGLALTLALGVLAIVAGWLARRRLLALVAGVGFLAAALVQIVQLGGHAEAVEHGVLGGDASTFAVWLGLGVGLIVVARAPDRTP